MLYTAGEILLFLIVAAGLGIAIGWTAKGLKLRGKLEAGFERDISSRQLRINTLEDELREAQDELDATQAALEDAEARIAQEQAATLTAQARLDEAEAAAAEMRARLEVLSQEVATLREAAAADDEREPLEAKLQELLVTLETRDRELAELRGRARAHQAERTVAESTPMVTAPAVPAARWQRGGTAEDGDPALDVEGMLTDPHPIREDRPAESPNRPQPLGDNEQHPDDDLKLIRGIGPKIEGTLKSIGITSYRQIALLTDRDIDALGDRLGHFRDRIRRDNWMASAAELHRKKYGADP